MVHVFTASYFAFVLVALPAIAAAKLARKPCILHYHDGRAEDQLSRFPFSRRLMKMADVIVVPSQFLADVFSRFGLASITISNVLDPRNLTYRERRELRPAFLHNRGMESVYNVECALRAFEIVQRYYPDASLRLAHDGSMRSQMEGQARALGLKNVEFTGTVAPAVMARMYDEADIYLTSADCDNMPGSVLECFAAGVPVVATAAGGTPLIVREGRNGLLVPCNDPDALARAALLLLTDPELARRLAANAYHDSQQYHWDRIEPHWVQLYSRLVSSSGDVQASQYPDVPEQSAVR